MESRVAVGGEAGTEAGTEGERVRGGGREGVYIAFVTLDITLDRIHRTSL